MVLVFFYLRGDNPTNPQTMRPNDAFRLGQVGILSKLRWVDELCMTLAGAEQPCESSPSLPSFRDWEFQDLAWGYCCQRCGSVKKLISVEASQENLRNQLVWDIGSQRETCAIWRVDCKVSALHDAAQELISEQSFWPIISATWQWEGSNVQVPQECLRPLCGHRFFLGMW